MSPPVGNNHETVNLPHETSRTQVAFHGGRFADIESLICELHVHGMHVGIAIHLRKDAHGQIKESMLTYSDSLDAQTAASPHHSTGNLTTIRD